MNKRWQLLWAAVILVNLLVICSYAAFSLRQQTGWTYSEVVAAFWTFLILACADVVLVLVWLWFRL